MQAQAVELQKAVDQGHQPWRTDPAMVAQTFVLSRFGWRNVDTRLTGPHTVAVTNRGTGEIVVLQLRQPVRQGQGGIWIVTGGHPSP